MGIFDFFKKDKTNTKSPVKEVPVPNIRWIKDPKEFNAELDKLDDIISNITIDLEGEESTFQLSSKGKTILDASLDQGIEASHLCKNGVCQTCKATLTSGKIIMNGEWCELAEEEIEEGEILLCQSHPITSNVKITCQKRTFFD